LGLFLTSHESFTLKKGSTASFNGGTGATNVPVAVSCGGVKTIIAASSKYTALPSADALPSPNRSLSPICHPSPADEAAGEVQRRVDKLVDEAATVDGKCSDVWYGREAGPN